MITVTGARTNAASASQRHTPRCDRKENAAATLTAAHPRPTATIAMLLSLAKTARVTIARVANTKLRRASQRCERPPWTLVLVVAAVSGMGTAAGCAGRWPADQLDEPEHGQQDDGEDEGEDDGGLAPEHEDQGGDGHGADAQPSAVGVGPRPGGPGAQVLALSADPVQGAGERGPAPDRSRRGAGEEGADGHDQARHQDHAQIGLGEVGQGVV